MASASSFSTINPATEETIENIRILHGSGNLGNQTEILADT